MWKGDGFWSNSGCPLFLYFLALFGAAGMDIDDRYEDTTNYLIPFCYAVNMPSCCSFFS
jgi:hypothetical protein